MQEQWDLGAGEDSVVSFQKAVKRHAKKARVCWRQEEEREHLRNQSQTHFSGGPSSGERWN